MSGPSESHTSRLAGLSVRLRESRAWLSLLLFCGAIAVVAFTLHGVRTDQSAAQNGSLDDGQLDAALLSLGAVGVSDSAMAGTREPASTGPLDLTAPDFADSARPAPLSGLDDAESGLNRAEPAILFEQATVTTGPLFGAPHSVPSARSEALPGSSRPSQPNTSADPLPGTFGRVITADGTQAANVGQPLSVRPVETAPGASGIPGTPAVRPVSGVRSAAWLTGTIE